LKCDCGEWGVVYVRGVLCMCVGCCVCVWGIIKSFVFYNMSDKCSGAICSDAVLLACGYSMALNAIMAVREKAGERWWFVVGGIGQILLVLSIMWGRSDLVEIPHFLFGILVLWGALFSRSLAIMWVVMMTIMVVIGMRFWYGACPLSMLEGKQKEVIPGFWAEMGRWLNWELLFPVLMGVAAWRSSKIEE